MPRVAQMVNTSISVEIIFSENDTGVRVEFFRSVEALRFYFENTSRLPRYIYPDCTWPMNMDKNIKIRK